jgi:DNA repair protein RecO (recombination protein O)
MIKISLQPSYILHRRPYRETSLLIELFTLEHGRLTLIAKGVRKTRSTTAGLLQPFVPLLVSWMGRSELMTLTQVESNHSSLSNNKSLPANHLFAGFYLNELLINLLQKYDPHPNLYTMYERTLLAMQAEILPQAALRSFEKCLLIEMGYGLLPTSELLLQQTFAEDRHYRFIFEQGFSACAAVSGDNIFSGKSLLALAKEDWQDVQSLRDAKRLMRLVLATLLGKKQIHSRRLLLAQVKEEECCNES